MITVLYPELSDALEIAGSDGALCCNEAFVDRETGKVFVAIDKLECGMSDAEQGLPKGLRRFSRYLRVPSKHDLDLGRPMVMAFVAESLPDDYDVVDEFFRHKGAYRKFRTLLERRTGALDRWYAHKDRATEAALRDWCETNDLELVKPPVAGV